MPVYGNIELSFESRVVMEERERKGWFSSMVGCVSYECSVISMHQFG